MRRSQRGSSPSTLGYVGPFSLPLPFSFSPLFFPLSFLSSFRLRFPLALPWCLCSFSHNHILSGYAKICTPTRINLVGLSFSAMLSLVVPFGVLMATSDLRDVSNPPVMITFYADLRSLLRGAVDEDSDSECEPGWDMVLLLHARSAFQLRSSTVEDLKKRCRQ